MDRKRRLHNDPVPASSKFTRRPKAVQEVPPADSDTPSARIQGFHPQHNGPEPSHRNEYARYRFIYTVILIVLLAVFAYSLYQLTAYAVHTIKAKREEQRIAEIIADSEPRYTIDPVVLNTDTDTDTDTNTDIAAATNTAIMPETTPAAAQTLPMETVSVSTNDHHTQSKPDVLIGLEKPLALNPDTVGQLTVGESINTFVVQRDNSYYLRHSFSGEYSFSGAIFLDVSCSIWPRSRNLIIHGHNMQNGTAFGKLLRFEKLEYLNQYPIIYFSTLYESAYYIPFAVVYYSIDPESDDYINLYGVNSFTDQEFAAFAAKVQRMSLYHLPVNIARTDEIITLTTCATEDPDMRFAVFAVKNNPQYIR